MINSKLVLFNKVSNNNIVLFLDMYYDIRIVTVNNNIEVYNSNLYNSIIGKKSNYNIKTNTALKKWMVK